MKNLMTFLILTMLASLTGKQGVADELRALPFDKNKVYFASVAEKDRGGLRVNQVAFWAAKFCPVANGEFFDCKSKEGYEVGHYQWAFTAVGTQKTNPDILMDARPYKHKGRFAMAAGKRGSRTIVPRDATYFFDARPGTVFVVGPQRESSKWALAQARRIMVENFGEQFGTLTYKHMSAALVSCEKKSFSKRKCTMGKAIDPREVSTRYSN